jgi:hypothetical protein
MTFKLGAASIDSTLGIELTRLTQQDIFTAMQGTKVFSSTLQNNSNVTVPSGSGGMPSDFRGAGVQPDVRIGQAQDVQAGSGQTRAASVPRALVQLLIESLQQKVAV